MESSLGADVFDGNSVKLKSSSNWVGSADGASVLGVADGACDGNVLGKRDGRKDGRKLGLIVSAIG